MMERNAASVCASGLDWVIAAKAVDKLAMITREEDNNDCDACDDSDECPVESPVISFDEGFDSAVDAANVDAIATLDAESEVAFTGARPTSLKSVNDCSHVLDNRALYATCHRSNSIRLQHVERPPSTVIVPAPESTLHLVDSCSHHGRDAFDTDHPMMHRASSLASLLSLPPVVPSAFDS
jgi:hypothetical protein